MNPKYRLALIIGLTVLILDQITKALVHNLMHLHQSIEIVPNFVHLTYLRNTGAAFGFLAGDRSALKTVFFLLVSGVAIGCIFYLLRNLRPGRNAETLSLSFILGGAVGNLIDRLRMGEVIDFMDLHWHHVHWPAFNVADSAITVGVILLLFQMIRKQSLNF
ncbi:MAG: signal peptidase II [Thermodesulfobacteriota bacterium]